MDCLGTNSNDMLYHFAFCALFLTTVISAEDKADCNVNNYYNNYYAGPQKDVQNLLKDIKTQLEELKMQVALLTKCNTSESRSLI